MSKAARAATIVFALLAFTCGFIGVAGGLELTQPANGHVTTAVQFKVLKNDTTNDVATRLEKQGLIRNSVLFKLLARYRKLDTKLEPGTYQIAPSMTMDAIIQTLLKGVPNELLITIPPGLRVTQYPAYFTSLPNFDAQSFIKTAQTGVEPDGTKLSDKFWYLPPKQPNTVYALEGYLFPDTYYFETSWTASDVIERMLAGLGEQLCPGPDQAHLDAYIHDAAQCKAHGAPVGAKKTNIFTDLEKYFDSNDVKAIYAALTLASIVVREAGQNPDDIPGVAGVYFNRLQLVKSDYLSPYGDPIVSLEADPTAQYARDTDSPPDTSKGGKWWAPLADSAKNVDPKNPYNTANPDHKGLPPGPIAAPLFKDIAAVAAAGEAPTPYYYFINDCHGKTWYAKTLAEQTTNEQQHPVTC